MTPATAASHRVPLNETTWSVWRDVCLRSAGFPADMVLAICDEPLARSADQAGEDDAVADPARRPGAPRPAYDLAYLEATRRLSAAIADTAADPAFREALTWQNPVLAQLLEDVGVGTGRRSKERQRELTIANYLQRYCLKNDTVGFFGPVGWARIVDDEVGLSVATRSEPLPLNRPPDRPTWLRAPAPVGENYSELKHLVETLQLHTVCESAACPNIGDCWNRRTATIMILGNVCTRRCGES